MESQSSLKKSIEEGGLCVGPVEHLLVGYMFRPSDAQHSPIAPSFKDVDHVLH